MVSLIWHPKALDDLKVITQFISRDSPMYGKLVTKKIKDAATRLKDFPLMGRIVPEINIKSVRELIIQKYRIIYQVNKQQIIILAVLHSAQEFRLSL